MQPQLDESMPPARFHDFLLHRTIRRRIAHDDVERHSRPRPKAPRHRYSFSGRLRVGITTLTDVILFSIESDLAKYRPYPHKKSQKHHQ
jgi:hypothetical protein